MSTIEAFKPILTNSTLPDFLPSQPLDNIIVVNTNCKAITDHIHAVLPLYTLQCLVVEGIFDHIIRNKNRFCVTKEDQLLLYVKGEGGVEKSCIIYALKMGFTLLNRRNGLMILALIRCATEGRGGSTVYITLSISTHKAKILYTNISRIWTHQSLLIIDELNMIQLELLAKIDK